MTASLSSSPVRHPSASNAAIPAASHHIPPPLNGYAFLEHRRSALSHDTFIARDVRQQQQHPEQQDNDQAKVIIRVYALEYLRRDEECRFALERECLTARLVVHPHLLPLGTPFTSKTDLFVVEKYCAGGDLYELMASLAKEDPITSETGAAKGGAPPRSSTGLPTNTVKRFMRELLSAVQYLHRTCGLVHRNIKLETLFIDEEQHLRLGSFGLCAVLPPPSVETGDREGALDALEDTASSSHAPLRLCCGSKHYAAPELVQGHPYQGEGVDAWACGIVLFALLTGCFPFDSNDGDEALFRLLCGDVEAHLAQHPAMAAIDDPQACDLVRNLLRPNPDARYTVSEALEHPYLWEA
ncbi:serine/threonine-protein kinase-like protein [Leishmania mexicana MHOM/GT/2001/U1103]|uniref:non-specific serine/threonine protein kinase n=1 Tax=Leishmania mexicana (strain MHOM/GT/2001/U1103) TaxID=929439 RepID=E9AUY2_LEIMU|nr:serine/threonine-protein kinase-like protein [Leishmania mexicana MHOM/GT/2001/U1103]CBZ26763.1 serine/threonine-protein kinase-like protein [Leishmania mexicana MHOM/GT/2001/U1103]